jgi:hypothetical protein
MGSSFRMGPGYFPSVLSGLLILLGAIMTALALRVPHVEGGHGRLPWRGILLVVGATLLFGAGLRGLGLVLPAVRAKREEAFQE